jgi:hypothetical protein
MFSEGKWGFNSRKYILKEFDVMKEFWEEPCLFSKSKVRRRMKGNERFVRFNGFKFYKADDKCLVSEEEFFKRYDRRRALKREDIYKRYIDKYKIMLNWLCVSYNSKELFGRILREILIMTNLIVMK